VGLFNQNRRCLTPEDLDFFIAVFQYNCNEAWWESDVVYLCSSGSCLMMGVSRSDSA
jgi:hypothetical protein